MLRQCVIAVDRAISEIYLTHQVFNTRINIDFVSLSCKHESTHARLPPETMELRMPLTTKVAINFCRKIHVSGHFGLARAGSAIKSNA